MAINKNKAKKLVTDIDHLFDEVTAFLPKETKSTIKNLLVGPALEELRSLVDESRPPVFLLFGRTGHGKSSLINALAGKIVAEPSDVKPGNAISIAYEIIFEDRYSAWTVVDTRGIFDSTKPNGAVLDNAVEQLKLDVLKYKPDVLIHVISAPEIRALSNDLIAFKEIAATLKTATGASIPTLVVITKPDTLGNPREWPPENLPKKAAQIKEALLYLSDSILKVTNSRQIDLNNTIKGFSVTDEVYIAIIPVCALENELWNIDTLSEFIGSKLPRSGLLNFVQAQKSSKQLKMLSSSIIKRFSTIATGIGAIPVPIADIIILTPLQLFLIAIIAGLSCREVSLDTAKEYLAAAGVNVGAAMGLRVLAQELVKLIPGIGSVISGAIAGGGTYGIGKAAESYFFDKVVKKPEDFQKGWQQ